MYILLLCIHLHRFVLDSGGANGHNGGGPNCQASEPVALLKDPPGNRYLVFNGINYLPTDAGFVENQQKTPPEGKGNSSSTQKVIWEGIG